VTICLKRVYDEAAPGDGFRVLVDRLWPRGVSKQRAALDLWLKEVAPSRELRTWFNHADDRFSEFSTRYVAELEDNPAISQLQRIVRENSITTLLYGAKNPKANHAIVLLKYLRSPDNLGH
jgi:uncharacterized protein YeaO (DUF488 family)